jgi:hypothetical protein
MGQTSGESGASSSHRVMGFCPNRSDVVTGEGTDTRMLAFEGETLRLPSVDDRIPPLG